MDTWLQFRLYHAVPIDSQRNLWDDRQYDRTRLWQPASHVRKSGGANMSFKEMKPEELQKNPFTMIGREWLLVTAEKDGKANTMTASWGGVGVMWEKCGFYRDPSAALYKGIYRWLRGLFPVCVG